MLHVLKEIVIQEAGPFCQTCHMIVIAVCSNKNGNQIKLSHLRSGCLHCTAQEYSWLCPPLAVFDGLGDPQDNLEAL